MRRLPGDVPVVPDAETARRWARDELADPAYHEKSLLDRIVAWVMELVADLFRRGEGTGADPRVVGFVLLAVVVVVALVALWIAGPVRRSRRAAKERIVFDAADVRTAEQMRAASAAAAEREDWHDAVLERFRAIVRSLEERALLEERAGRTALEVADDAGRRLPGLRDELLAASGVFNEVRYGDGTGSRAEYDRLVALDDAARESRPAREQDDDRAQSGWTLAGTS